MKTARPARCWGHSAGLAPGSAPHHSGAWCGTVRADPQISALFFQSGDAPRGHAASSAVVTKPDALSQSK